MSAAFQVLNPSHRPLQRSSKISMAPHREAYGLVYISRNTRRYLWDSAGLISKGKSLRVTDSVI